MHREPTCQQGMASSETSWLGQAKGSDTASYTRSLLCLGMYPFAQYRQPFTSLLETVLEDAVGRAPGRPESASEQHIRPRHCRGVGLSDRSM